MKFRLKIRLQVGGAGCSFRICCQMRVSWFLSFYSTRAPHITSLETKMRRGVERFFSFLKNGKSRGFFWFWYHNGEMSFCFKERRGWHICVCTIVVERLAQVIYTLRESVRGVCVSCFCGQIQKGFFAYHHSHFFFFGPPYIYIYYPSLFIHTHPTILGLVICDIYIYICIVCVFLSSLIISHHKNNLRFLQLEFFAKVISFFLKEIEAACFPVAFRNYWLFLVIYRTP